MDQPKRKPLRIPQFAYSAPGAYFVTICTLNRRCVLSSISAEPGIADGPRTNLTEIGKTVEKYILSSTRIPNLHVEKYVIMPNHVHLLLIIEAGENDMRESTPANQALPHAIGTLKRFVNRDVGYNIWQRSYYEHVIRNENDYQEIWQYIESNPGRWIDDRYYDSP